jgi:ABC-type branched-subunit amino acid transport system ATPase component
VNDLATPAPNPTAILDVNSLVVRYGTKTAVDGVTLQIEGVRFSACLGRTVRGRPVRSVRSRGW